MRKKVLLVEDAQNYREIATYLLEEAGHEVITAGSLDEALQLVGQLKELAVNVAVIDGNLVRGDNSGNDGKRIANEIKKAAPDVKTIAWSSTNYTWGDTFVSKFNLQGTDSEGINALLGAVGN